MAPPWKRFNTWAIWGAFLFAHAQATPAVALPFNSQVPTVARVDEPYSFQLSSSTFIPEASNFTYSLSDQPSWLAIDSTTRTLSGTPTSTDIGSRTFTLTAADDTGAAHMSCTIVVSSDSAPRLDGDVSKQLAATANLSSTEPPIVTLLPSTSFAFQFEQSSFIDIVQRKLYYYATLADHTPLPSWILFDEDTLSFAGLAPQLSAFPQSWSIDLIASDVVGFAGASATFEVSVGVHQLVFAPEEQVVNITAGSEVNFKRLGETLFLNGIRVSTDTLQTAQATTPGWLQFDPLSLEFTGLAPANVSDFNVTVTVTDLFGNEATGIVTFVTGDSSDLPVFASEIGTLTARSGQEFEYTVSDDLFVGKVVDTQMLLPTTAPWLKYDTSTRTLSGKVPDQAETSKVTATLSARLEESADTQTQIFYVEILASVTATSTIEGGGAHSTIFPTASGVPEVAADDTTTQRLPKGAMAGIVAGSVVAVLALVACVLLCLRRRQRRKGNGYVDYEDQIRPSISRPILPVEPASILVTREVETDLEKNAGDGTSLGDEKEDDPPPQIALDLPDQSQKKRMKWSKRFSRISQVSSIGNGEDAIRADSNIPELGHQASNTTHTPHDSFSVPTQIARSSRHMSEMSPSKRALQRLQRQRQSGQSIGLGIDTGGGALLPRHSIKSARSHRRARSSLGLSTVVDGSSLASVSTRGTSVLSTRASDFPRPNTFSTFGSRATPAHALSAADKRKSIRLVDRSDSIADNRSLHEKRQSFIRNRASTSLASPLFAHGARLSSTPLQNGQSSRDTSMVGSQRRSRRGKSQLTSYSESSSLEPSTRDSRRLSARVRSVFAPNYPRAVTKSTLGADDEASAYHRETSSGFETISSSNNGSEWRAEMALPRNERSWVLPNEASPTPPPAPPTSRRPSTTRRSSSRDSEARQMWKNRFREHSSSPLSTAVAVPIADPRLVPGSDRSGKHRHNRLSEPISLVSSDSLNRSKLERPRLVHTNSKRPVSVEKVQRLSSLKAETDDARPGSEMWEAMEEAGLMPPNSRDGKEGTQRSNMSGPAFI